MAAPPHILSNPAEKFVTERSAHSIFSVRSSPRGTKFENDMRAQTDYVKLMKRVMSKEDSNENNSWPKLEKTSSVATGFVFEKPTDVLHILTAAHIIQEAYLDSCPLDNSHIDALNRAYYFDVTCIHQGRDFQSSGQGANRDVNDIYMPATVVAISSAHDLMLLQINREHLRVKCTADHNTISGIAVSAPPRCERVLMQGWPENKCDTSIWGYVSTIREYKWLTQTNPLGYKMRLIELPGLECEVGCSGGPLVDGNLRCVGVCHATLNGSCYAVNVPDIRNFLISGGLMVDRSAAPVAAAAAKVGHEDSEAEHEAAKSKGLPQGQQDNKHDQEPSRGNGNKDEGKARRVRAAKTRTQVEEDEEEEDEHEEGKKDRDEEWVPKKDKQRGRGRGR